MASGSRAPASGCDNQVEGKGEKREKSNREHSSKVLASKKLHYICMGICVRRPYQWTELQNARIRGGIASPIEDYTSGSLRLAACRREYIEVLQVASPSSISK